MHIQSVSSINFNWFFVLHAANLCIVYLHRLVCLSRIIHVFVACATDISNQNEIFNMPTEFEYLKFVSDLRIAFDLLDRNQDGRVTASELQFMLKNLGIIVRDELIDDLIKEASHGGNKSTNTIF